MPFVQNSILSPTIRNKHDKRVKLLSRGIWNGLPMLREACNEFRLLACFTRPDRIDPVSLMTIEPWRALGKRRRNPRRFGFLSTRRRNCRESACLDAPSIMNKRWAYLQGKTGSGLATIKSLRINWIEAASSIRGCLWSWKGQSSRRLRLNGGWLTLRSWQPLRWLGEIDASSSRTLSLLKRGPSPLASNPWFEDVVSSPCRLRVIARKARCFSTTAQNSCVDSADECWDHSDPVSVALLIFCDCRSKLHLFFFYTLYFKIFITINNKFWNEYSCRNLNRSFICND